MAVNNIKDYCIKNNIDAQIRDDGVFYGATNKFHKGAFESLIKDLNENQINSWERLSKEKVQHLTGSKKFIDGYYSPIGGSLQPALLVRGLKKSAENKGIKIYEKSTALSYSGKKEIIVKTNKGSINCKKLICCNECMDTHFITLFITKCNFSFFRHDHNRTYKK